MNTRSFALHSIRILGLLAWVMVWVLLLSLFSSPALGQQAVKVATALALCQDGSPKLYAVVDATGDTDCATGGGSTENICSCLGGTLADFGGSGGSGDITDVWGCTSGNCNALTGASGDSFDAGSADTSKPATRTTSTMSTCAEGQLHQETDSGGSELFICTATDTVAKLATTDEVTAAARVPSVLNPRPTPHANDCEFSSGVCGSWNLHADFSSGTVDPAAQVSGGDIYDCTSWSGWCLFQDYTASTPAFKPGVYLDYTPATEETWWFHVTAGTGGSSTDENRIGLCYRNSGDTNEAVCFGYHSSGGAERIELYVSNNGGLTSTCVMALGGAGSDDVVMFLQKDTNDYYAGIVRTNGGGAYGNTGTNRSPYYCGVVTKTGVTTFNRMSMMMGDSDDDPTPIQGIDFIRYAASRTFAFVNP